MRFIKAIKFLYLKIVSLFLELINSHFYLLHHISTTLVELCWQIHYAVGFILYQFLVTSENIFFNCLTDNAQVILFKRSLLSFHL